MNNIFVEGELPKSCDNCEFGYFYDCQYCTLRPDLMRKDEWCEKEKHCKLLSLSDRLAEERKKVVSELKVDIRSLFNSYASSLIDYCIWNKNADENQKLYNNFKRIINDRLVKVLDLFDKRIDQIERDK